MIVEEKNEVEDDKNKCIELLYKIPKVGYKLGHLWVEYTIKWPIDIAKNTAFFLCNTFVVKPVVFCYSSWVGVLGYSLGQIKRVIG